MKVAEVVRYEGTQQASASEHGHEHEHEHELQALRPLSAFSLHTRKTLAPAALKVGEDSSESSEVILDQSESESESSDLFWSSSFEGNKKPTSFRGMHRSCKNQRQQLMMDRDECLRCGVAALSNGSQ